MLMPHLLKIRMQYYTVGKGFMNRVVTESAKSVLQVGNMMDWLQFNGDSGSNDLLLC